MNEEQQKKFKKLMKIFKSATMYWVLDSYQEGEQEARDKAAKRIMKLDTQDTSTLRNILDWIGNQL
jgi:hypothetical protein